MQKIVELIEQVRFAELKKIDKMSSAQETYINETLDSNPNSSN